MTAKFPKSPKSRLGNLRSLAALALIGSCAGAFAQDMNALLQQQMNQTNRMMQEAQRQSQMLSQTMNRTQTNMIQQKMQDPQVQSAYRAYLQQMQATGRQPMDFATYTGEYIYTNGFSREGIAHRNRIESGNRAAEQQRLQGVRQAEQNRSDSMQQQRDGYIRNQQEAGRGLMGQSTYSGPNGTQPALPHTWQPNTSHVYQGNTYRVNESGQYYVRSADGWWHPVNR
ncbi:MAG: hypothetical protein IPP87_04465 [Ideonella sp.]|nr:hypothetical protein [Ideonella sp.]